MVRGRECGVYGFSRPRRIGVADTQTFDAVWKKNNENVEKIILTF